MLKVTLIALGDKMPAWITQGFEEYRKRLQQGMQFNLIELSLVQRKKNADIARLLTKEMDQLLEAIPKQAYVIALDCTGASYTSEQMASKIEHLTRHNSHLCFIIGGPEGLTQAFLKTCQTKWSLSKLTLPHPLVRIVFIESFYRAWSIIHNHPYHRA